MLRLIALLLWLLPLPLLAAEWEIVPRETTVEVDVHYLGNVVTMRFPTILGNILFDEKRPEAAKAAIAVGTRDVQTGFVLVDEFVKSEAYLNAREYPQIDFRLDRLVQTSKSTADIFGRMTFLGVTQPITFKAEVFRYGPMPGEPARFDAGFRLRGEVDRTLFGQTAGLPEVEPVLPVRIRLLMRSKG